MAGNISSKSYSGIGGGGGPQILHLQLLKPFIQHYVRASWQQLQTAFQLRFYKLSTRAFWDHLPFISSRAKSPQTKSN